MSPIPWKCKRPEGRPEETSPITALRSEMERLFNTYVREPWDTADWSFADWPFGAGTRWSPAVDIAESDREVIVRAELPGIDPDDIEVSVTGNHLVLSGEKKESTEHKGKDFYHAESRFGAFHRSIPLPEAVDPKQVRAEFANGVLTVRLEKSAASVPKRITVKVRGGKSAVDD